ncbi:transcriptional regulator [Pseudomonas sp. FW215-R2]|jgi:transcriptional regulator with XRE-family HTH domain|uniref:helix-turn-helix domain-containing protein n=1 Tax=unclassified Pseudomonas TaxID=196821 RepID=UPI000C889F64|nr:MULTISPECIES: helix-turn-helix transcriptional regulator [unclassified Pseudomonas]PMX02342.1 transcriptional regulator [Pseudomonas sp. FW215-R2]PMX11028.1 transcriptional regulator [Pseudomonas sp. FW215-L1]PMX20787.1 transcriptional regulator [Pseudomonas sp. FW215-E1]PNA21744.1 transcriptional regulator [Pseudomonas sp. FW215-R4]
MSTFTERLKDARKSAGLSQERLGIEAGLEPASASARMNQYEKGVHHPGESTVQQIAAVLNLPAAFFYCEDDDTAYLLQCFHCLKNDDRKQVIELAESLALRH